MEAACELQALLQRRAAFGLGPLLHEQLFFPEVGTESALERVACPAPGLLSALQSDTWAQEVTW